MSKDFLFGIIEEVDAERGQQSPAAARLMRLTCKLNERVKVTEGLLVNMLFEDDALRSGLEKSASASLIVTSSSLFSSIAGVLLPLLVSESYSLRS